MLSKLFAITILISILAAAPAAGSPDVETGSCTAVGSDKVTGMLAIRARGTVLENGAYQLVVEPGKVATRAGRVYSEPLLSKIKALDF